MKQTRSLGFTLLELLVVVSLIALLISVVFVSIGNSRVRSRDTIRLEHISQLRSGLDLFFNHASGYPDSSKWVVNDSITCSGEELIKKVPQDPFPAFDYIYNPTGKSAKGCGGSTVWTAYKFQFYLEGYTSYGPPGFYCMRPVEVVTTGPCP